MMRDRLSSGAAIAAWTIAAIVAIVHLYAAGRYGFFRNELYFIVCGRHPAFGYVDQPPLIPILAAITQSAGSHLFLLRLPAVLAAILLVPMTVLLAQQLGASARGAWLSAVAAASAPLVTAMNATLTTATLEPIAFTAIAYYVTRAVTRDEPKAFWWAGIVAGIAFEARYGVAFWTFAIIVGLVLAGPRTALRSRHALGGLAIATLIALPNVLWQIVHGLPFLELVRNDSSGNLTGGPVFFAIDQVFSINVLLAPLWIAGLIGPFAAARLAPYRFLAVTFIVMAVIVFVSHGKSYYLAPAYPTAFALGAALCSALPRVLVAVWAVLAAVNGALALPLVLPVVRPATLQHMLDTGFRPRPIERAGIGAPLMQVFDDEFGWPELARTVERVYGSLSPEERSRATIYAENYGDASAINVFGRGLPTAVSANNQYYLWGTNGSDGSVVIAVNVDPGSWARLCSSANVVAYFGASPYAMPYERHRPIVLCRDMHPSLQAMWPQFKHYGIENLGQSWTLPRRGP